MIIVMHAGSGRHKGRLNDLSNDFRFECKKLVNCVT